MVMRAAFIVSPLKTIVINSGVINAIGLNDARQLRDQLTKAIEEWVAIELEENAGTSQSPDALCLGCGSPLILGETCPSCLFR